MFGLFSKKPKPEPKPEAAKASIYDLIDEAYSDTTNAEALTQYVNDNAIKVNAPMPEGVAMDSIDIVPNIRADYGQVNPVMMAHYVASGSFIGYYAMAVIAQNWLVRKGCELKPRDAARNWYDIESNHELSAAQIKAIEKLDRKLDLRQNVIEALTFNNIFGVRHVFFKHTNPDFDYSTPFSADEFANGGYAGIAQIDPTRAIPELSNADLTDPTSINYLNPTWWIVGDKKIHRSHMVILTGDHVADMLKPTYRYGGVSMVQKVYERVYAAERTANEAPQLAMTKRLTWRKTDLSQVASQPSKFARAMRKLTDFRNNFGVQLIGTDEEMGQLDTTLTDVNETIMGQYQLVCAIFDEPASKLLGTGHSGFSTGDADIDMRNESLEQLQSNEMSRIVESHYERLVASYGSRLQLPQGTELTAEWLPLSVLTDGERADINLKNRQADQIAYTAQAIDNYELRERMINDPNSGFNGLEMPEPEPTEAAEPVDNGQP